VQSNLHIPFGLYKSVADKIYKKHLQLESSDYSCAEAMKNSDIPILFIHGTDDRFVPINMTFENYKACPSPKELLVVPGAEHGMSYLVDKELYEKKSRTFHSALLFYYVIRLEIALLYSRASDSADATSS
jgi:alpha-beta hydrolase superfamily lysophospholipase